MKRHPLERVVRAHNRDGKGAMQVKSEGHEALRRAGLSIQECAAAFAVLSVAASMVPMPSMKTIAKIRLRMLYETHGLLCIFTLSFWRCAQKLTHNSEEGVENDTKTNHRPSGTMCATCTHAQKDCSALEFSTMRAIKKDADGTIVVRCGEYKRVEK